MGLPEHRKNAAQNARVAIITVSDTRDLKSDKSGQEIARLVEEAKHAVADRVVVCDEPTPIGAALRGFLGDAGVDAVILTGGTGLAARDGTVEVVRRFLDREIPGFGELFRALSFEEIGAAAMLSRALGGLASGKAVFSLPGSTNAVRTAMVKLILPELGHLLTEIRK